MLRSFNFALGSLLAGLSGVLAAGQIGLNPNMGDDLLMPSFIAIIVGGVGSLTGTLLGGLLIGVASALTTIVWPAASEAVIYVIMAVVLLIRPRGLMGEEGMLDMNSATVLGAASRRAELRWLPLSPSGRYCSPRRFGCRCLAATRHSQAACSCWASRRWDSTSCWASPG